MLVLELLQPHMVQIYFHFYSLIATIHSTFEVIVLTTQLSFGQKLMHFNVSANYACLKNWTGMNEGKKESWTFTDRYMRDTDQRVCDKYIMHRK